MAVLRWESCSGVYGQFDAPRDQVRPAVPIAFDLSGQTSATAELEFVAVVCGKVSTGSRVLANQPVFSFLAWVHPANKTWDSGNSSRFTLATLVTDSDLAAAIRSMGGAAVVASLSRNTTQTPAGAYTDDWFFRTPDRTIGLQYAASGQSRDGGGTQPAYWTPAGNAFRKIEVTNKYLYDKLLLEAGVLRVGGGTGGWPFLQGGCCAEWSGSPIFSDSQFWSENRTAYPT